ncbi:MAG: phosphoesterase PA-phosphatase related protein [Firmicutes bacterium]|nr:phosphoesterase PA-phosphatase related protein [Bacillota bacterium]
MVAHFILSEVLEMIVLTKHKWMSSFSFLVMIWSFLIMGMAFCAGDDSDEYPDVFVHENIQISPDQAIGRLMVTSGSAVVYGKVVESIIVVDGNVTIESGAMVNGRVVVIGGDVIVQQGAKLKENPWVIAPQGHSVVSLVVSAFYLLGAGSLIIVPVLFWLIGHLFKKTAWYSPLKEQFLAVQRRWPALYIAASLGISVLMLTVFGVLAWETLFRNVMGVFDNTFIWFVRYFASPGVDKVMISITDVGFGVSYVVIVTSSFLLLTYYRRWREIAGLAICLTGGGVLNFWLKYLFHRSRPDLLRVVQETGYSFPSGHVIASMCFYGMMAFLIMRTISSWRGRLTVMTLAVVLNVAIGISRIYLGVHYPTDVVAGYAAGSMWLAFCISILMWWERERAQQ